MCCGPGLLVESSSPGRVAVSSAAIVSTFAQSAAHRHNLPPLTNTRETTWSGRRGKRIDRFAATEPRSVQRIANPELVGPVGLEPAEHHRHSVAGRPNEIESVEASAAAASIPTVPTRRGAQDPLDLRDRASRVLPFQGRGYVQHADIDSAVGLSHRRHQFLEPPRAPPADPAIKGVAGLGDPGCRMDRYRCGTRFLARSSSRFRHQLLRRGRADQLIPEQRDTGDGVEHPKRVVVHCIPARIRQILADDTPTELYHWFLSYTVRSRVPNPIRLAVPDRPGLISATSCPHRRLPDRTALCSYQAAATAQREGLRPLN